jgi:hypothetical protein
VISLFINISSNVGTGDKKSNLSHRDHVLYGVNLFLFEKRERERVREKRELENMIDLVNFCRNKKEVLEKE